MKVRRRLALGYVPCAINANEEERYAARFGTLQGRKSMANCREACFKRLTEKVDVVSNSST
jgi:hypothetical protein